MSDDLIIIPNETALQVFTTTGAITPYLEKIQKAVSGVAPDLSTDRGRKGVASLAFRVTKAKTYLEGVGKQLADEQKEIPRRIDATRKQAREFLDNLAEEVRRPLTEWEAEQERIDREAKERAESIQLGIDSLRAAGEGMAGAEADQIASAIDSLQMVEITAEVFGDRLDDAEQTRSESMAKLQALHASRIKYEAEQVELADLRRLQSERDRRAREERMKREAAEQATRIAEQAAKAEIEAAEKRIREAEAAAARQKFEAQRQQEEAAEILRQAEERAHRSAQAERDRIAEEQRIADADARAREANVKHRRAVNTRAMNAFVDGGLDAESAKLAVTLIARRAIPAISIEY